MSVRGEIEGDVLASMQEFVMTDGASGRMTVAVGEVWRRDGLNEF